MKIDAFCISENFSYFIDSFAVTGKIDLLSDRTNTVQTAEMPTGADTARARFSINGTKRSASLTTCELLCPKRNATFRHPLHVNDQHWYLSSVDLCVGQPRKLQVTTPAASPYADRDACPDLIAASVAPMACPAGLRSPSHCRGPTETSRSKQVTVRAAAARSFRRLEE